MLSDLLALVRIAVVRPAPGSQVSHADTRFDMSKTAKDLLGLEIKWSQGELIPEYLTLVCGAFYQKAA